MTIAPRILTRSAVEDFLYDEAALLDEWRLDEWLDLFVEGATYEVPAAGARDDADPAQTLFYIADDYDRLRHRVDRLKKTTAHAEYPRSDTLHMVSNVRILGQEGDDVTVGAAFATYRSKADMTDVYCGHHRYRLRQVDGRLRIAAKRSLLDMSSLRPQGRISIIV
ncbi:aromatic-ring-hydroxylating dioxygenase subunit beta [Zavarzinia sp. CC-PAN008]|uniref:aromatic-ring-hydroxylating dioxygenase subunit beta n=1 Tax=Zavarzinia sp. CC-PAN008 TaxID=3243332 RepID=UPI003F742506